MSGFIQPPASVIVDVLLDAYVPYTGSKNNLNIGAHDLTVGGNIVNTALKNALDGYATTVAMDSYVSVNCVPYVGATGDVNLDTHSIISGGITCIGLSTLQGQVNEGELNIVSGTDAHAEGNSNTSDGDYSHTEGQGNGAHDGSSHAEGYATQAGTFAAHSEGESTYAGGEASHAEGFSTAAEGFCSHSEGDSCGAYAFASHAQGEQSSATREGQHAQACGAFSSSGDAQTSVLVLRGSTPGAVANESIELLYGTSLDQSFSLSDGMAYMCVTEIVAASNADSALFRFSFLCRQDGGTPLVAVGAQEQIYTLGAATWEINVTAPSDIAITFSTGAGVTTAVNIVCNLRFTEIVHP